MRKRKTFYLFLFFLSMYKKPNPNKFEFVNPNLFK